MEALSPRLMLSVTLVKDELHVDGTGSADRISVGATPFINALVVDDNNVLHYYALSAIKTMIINAKAGDDRVTVDPALNALGYQCVIYGGSGNDTLTGSGGKVHINGEEGNDRIRVYATVSGELIGENGRDCLYGSDTSDTIVGGGGNDKIYGFGGKDIIASNLGNDRVDAGAGNDTVTDTGGRDSLRGGAGNDVVKGLGAATVLGDEGDDTVVGTNVSGGEGNDVCYGTASGDLIHGDGGNDLIKGGVGKDVLYGDDGDDAIFGGSGDDELHGGGGNDNLYGSDGFTDKNRDDDGHDAGLGEGGADWFEGPHVWRSADWREGVDQQAQNKLAQDPSVGHYKANEGVLVLNASGGVNHYGGVLGSSNLQFSMTNGSLITIAGGGLIKIGAGGMAIASSIITKSLGQGGWLTSGAWDVAQQKFVPVALTSDQRKPLRHVIMQLPKGWSALETIQGGNGIAYLRVSQPNGITVSPGGKLQVPTTDGGSIGVPGGTPGLVDGVEGGRYRYLAVSSGTVIISNAGELTDVKQWDWTSALVVLPTEGDVRIAGDGSVHTLASTFAHVPGAVPDGARGILVADGAVWLPGDGSAATFTAG